ncbi:MAG: PqqD family protein [Bacteriovoracaceae bacterium]
MADTTVKYGLAPDVYCSFDKERNVSRIIKLDDSDFFFECDRIACEIITQINGKTRYADIVKIVAGQYDSAHLQEIEAEAEKFLDKLLQYSIVQRVG